MRFLLTHPSETRPSLVVDTCLHIDDATIGRLKEDLFALGCSSGLLFDSETCVILRDSFASMTPGSIVVEPDRPATDAVLAKLGSAGQLDDRVGRWLEMLSGHWDSALPLEPKVAAPFFTDIVPAASGSMVHPLG